MSILEKALMDQCLINAINDSTPTEAADMGLSYIDLIKVRYETNLAYAQQEHELEQYRMRGL